MSERIDKATLWTARVVFVLMTLIGGWLVYSFGWKIFHDMPYLRLCGIGYVAAGWASVTGRKPDILRVQARADREAYKTMLIMLTIFGLAAIAIGIYLWLAKR